MGNCSCVSNIEEQSTTAIADIPYKHQQELIESELLEPNPNSKSKLIQALTRAYLARKRFRRHSKRLSTEPSYSKIDLSLYLPSEILQILQKTPDFNPIVSGELLHLPNNKLFIGELSLSTDPTPGHLISPEAYYSGYLQNFTYQGNGTLIKTNGDIYKGSFNNGNFHGQGDLTCPKQNFRYSGSWQQGEHSGRGVEFNPDGSVCIADFIRGVKSGSGEINWQDGSSYSGSFRKDQMNGFGKFLWNDGRVYEGCWKDGQMHGKGVMDAPDGRRYEGEFVNNKKEGFGVYRWPDGKEYKGTWKDGKQHGIGDLTERNKKPKRGEWKLGKRIRWIE